MTTFYDQDFYTWTQQQAEALRAGRLSDLDLANLAEEIESIGNAERQQLKNHLAVLLAYLLKWQYKPKQRSRHGRSWRLAIKEQRMQLDSLLRDSPGLKPLVDQSISHSYALARLIAVHETNLSEAEFPEVCPWGWEAITDEDFLPD